ncbi:hypothetical protein AOL_s00083g476 [Orbilia oligospora ATCC 24927]|uniref:Uncharacterized protein n=1 Tax=Arthrobotrys oligospora (strain ATCC 24927 / CBS 115.81 / DSM 1491) TaxID=756982 RepID=G1XHJ5_ARTOA|nr:hypothetical protein AOL_s00083g476 [Orbilia oligospora ATCC 24927]EGX47383.1 hypothetical protein AOL_s00083g476 [Orbilia oligospora ATCC 24927]
MGLKFPHIKIVFGAVVFLSLLFFTLSSYRVSGVLPIHLSNEIPSIRTVTATVTVTATTTFTTAITTTSITKTKVQTKTSPPESTTTTTTIDPSQLDIEQIEADFPLGYKNPNPWFRTPASPRTYAKDLMSLLTDDQLALLPGFRAAALNWPEKVRKIESFYGINRTGSWQDHINSLDDDGLSPLTKWAQQYIYDHQHPEDCTGKKFYVLKNKWPRHGLGAIIRRVFIEMSAAIQTDRILIFDPEDSPGNTLVEETCGKHVGAKASLECVIERLSSCASYATKENSVHQIDPSEVKDGKIRDTVPFAELAYSSYFGGSGVSPGGSVLRYWWRAQLYGYILRPNRAALERMTELRLNKTLHQGVETNRGNVEEPEAREVPFPLPPSTVSIHIRHGDKAGEGRLISTRDYIVAAERFILRNPLSYIKRAFMSTEDPGAIAEAKRTPFVNPVRSFGNVDWTWYYSNIPRVDGGPQANLALAHNKTDSLLTHMMQLWMAVECDTFVGNRNSNWNKMIDAIRCTLMDKCRAPYIDAGFVADWINFP